MTLVLQCDFEWSRVGFCGQPGCWVKYYALSGQGAWIVVRVYLQRVYVRGSNMTDCKTVHPPARSRAISPSAMLPTWGAWRDNMAHWLESGGLQGPRWAQHGWSDHGPMSGNRRPVSVKARNSWRARWKQSRKFWRAHSKQTWPGSGAGKEKQQLTKKEPFQMGRMCPRLCNRDRPS